MATQMKNKNPEDNKFHVGNRDDGKHYWLTPPEIYEPLDAEFHFDFDPCPYPVPDGLDGLTCEWGESNYANIPFGSIIHNGKKKGPTAWMRKAIEENKKGKTVVVLYPIDKWVLMMLAAGAEVRNMGDIRWLATEDKSQGKGTGRHIAAFILRGKNKDRATDIKERVPEQTNNSSMPKCPAPAPCKDMLPDRICGRVPKCFSRYGTSA